MYPTKLSDAGLVRRAAEAGIRGKLWNELGVLIDYYIKRGVHGIIPLGTTGESPTITDEEYEQIIAKTAEFVNNRVPIFVGLGGNDTKRVIKKLRTVETYEVNGILSVCPYYNRPDQNGIYEHFLKISESTDLEIVIYNIPYRTGRNSPSYELKSTCSSRNGVIIGNQTP